jgi:hypothetical protein
MRPYLEKNPSHKRAFAVAQCVGPEFKSQSTKAATRKNKSFIFLASYWCLFWSHVSSPLFAKYEDFRVG